MMFATEQGENVEKLQVIASSSSYQMMFAGGAR
jgi:hypothetical protein